MRRRPPLRLAWVPLAAALGAAPAPADDPSPRPARQSELNTEDCLFLPAVSVYMHRVQDRIMEAWVVPEDLMANEEVVVNLVLVGDGSLERAELVSTTNDRLAASVLLAIERSAPFDPIPDSAACAAGRTIVTRFRNPY